MQHFIADCKTPDYSFRNCAILFYSLIIVQLKMSMRLLKTNLMTYKNTALWKGTAHLYRKLKFLWTDYSFYPQKEFYKLLLLKADLHLQCSPKPQLFLCFTWASSYKNTTKIQSARKNQNQKIGSQQISQIKVFIALVITLCGSSSY